jgi:hypothetical protein
MNIFTVLSLGNGKLHEANMSAMLGYLLDTSNDHGLGDSIVRKLLTSIDNDRFKEILEMDDIYTSVDLEAKYEQDSNNYFIDIELRIFTRIERQNQEDGVLWNELHRIIIENKTRRESANENQLINYYNAVIEELEDETNLSMIFLTPNEPGEKLTAEWNALTINNDNHCKNWIFWNSYNNNDDQVSISSILSNILKEEADGIITPINGYMLHTLKAFKQYVSKIGVKKKRFTYNKNIDEIITTRKIKIDGNPYTLVKTNTNRFVMYDKDGKEVSKRSLLRKYVKSNELLNNDNVHTNTLGNAILKEKISDN